MASGGWYYVYSSVAKIVRIAQVILFNKKFIHFLIVEILTIDLFTGELLI